MSLVLLLRELATSIGSKRPTRIGNKGNKTESKARTRKRENSRAALATFEPGPTGNLSYGQIKPVIAR